MGILSFLNGAGLKKSWSYETAAPDVIVWKLLISPSGILTGEERNVEKKTASLFALDVRSGKMLWRGRELDEAWWFGMERATDERLYVHRFRKPDMPEAKGIIAIDLITGKTIWEQPELVLIADLGDEVIAMRQGFERQDFFKLEGASGNPIEELGRDAAIVKPYLELAEAQDKKSLYTASITPGSEHFDAVEGLLRNVLRVEDVRGSIDFLEFGSYVLFSYHERIKSDANAMLRNLLKNELVVIDRESSDIVFRDTLHRETPFPVPDNFFINNDTLIYVKEKRELTGVRLA